MGLCRLQEFAPKPRGRPTPGFKKPGSSATKSDAIIRIFTADHLNDNFKKMAISLSRPNQIWVHLAIVQALGRTLDLTSRHKSVYMNPPVQCSQILEISFATYLQITTPAKTPTIPTLFLFVGSQPLEIGAFGRGRSAPKKPSRRTKAGLSLIWKLIVANFFVLCFPSETDLKLVLDRSDGDSRKIGNLGKS